MATSPSVAIARSSARLAARAPKRDLALGRSQYFAGVSRPKLCELRTLRAAPVLLRNGVGLKTGWICSDMGHSRCCDGKAATGMPYST